MHSINALCFPVAGQGNESVARVTLDEVESLAAEIAAEPDSELRREIETARM